MPEEELYEEGGMFELNFYENELTLTWEASNGVPLKTFHLTSNYLIKWQIFDQVSKSTFRSIGR